MNSQIVCIVLNWNGGERTLRCIRSLVASRGVTPSVLVVDNGSDDGSTEAIRREFSTIRILQNSSNAGLAEARNTGVRDALSLTADFLLFIDDDAYVADDCLRLLIETAMSAPGIGLVTPRILDANREGHIWYDGGIVDSLGITRHRHKGDSVEHRRAGAPLDIAFATGCCCLIRREVFDRAGYLDERYVVYSEDADFSFRARGAGFRIVHVPTATAWHHQSADTRENRGKWFRDYYGTRNMFLLLSTHRSGLRLIGAFSWFALRDVMLRSAYFVVTCQWNRVRAVWSGLTDFVRARFGKRFS